MSLARQGVEPILPCDVWGVIKQLLTRTPLVSLWVVCSHAFSVVRPKIRIPEEEGGEAMGRGIDRVGLGRAQESSLHEELLLLFSGEALLRLGPPSQTVAEDFLRVYS